jgi:hypothetical protein
VKFDGIGFDRCGDMHPVRMRSLNPTHHAPRKIDLANHFRDAIAWCCRSMQTLNLKVSNKKHVFSPKRASFDSPVLMPGAAPCWQSLPGLVMRGTSNVIRRDVE